MTKLYNPYVFQVLQVLQILLRDVSAFRILVAAGHKALCHRCTSGTFVAATPDHTRMSKGNATQTTGRKRGPRGGDNEQKNSIHK